MRLKDIIANLLNFFSGIINRLTGLFTPVKSAEKAASDSIPDSYADEESLIDMPAKMSRKKTDKIKGKISIPSQQNQRSEPPEPPLPSEDEMTAITEEEAAPMEKEAMEEEFSGSEMSEEPHMQPETKGESGQAVRAATHLQGDIVNVSAFCPEQVSAGQSFLLNVFAHLYEQREEIATMAREADEDTRLQAAKSLNMPILRGTSLYVHLTIEDWKIENATQQMVWFGVPTSVEFEVPVPAAIKSEKAIGTLIISNMHGPIGRLKFNLQIINESETSAPEGEAQVRSLAYSQAYMAFAPDDMPQVDAHLLSLQQTGVSFIRTQEGQADEWEVELVGHLKESELFYLFWSSAAENSEAIEAEWQYALRFRNSSENRLPDIIPIVVEDPGPEPPAELAFLNFTSAGPNPMASLKENCRDLLDNWNETVFDLLIDHFQADVEIHQDLVTLRRRWHELEKQKRMGFTSEEKLRQSRLELTYNIQAFIGQIY